MRARAGGRDDPGCVRHGHLLPRQPPVLGAEPRGDQPQPEQDGGPLHPHLAPRPGHPRHGD